MAIVKSQSIKSQQDGITMRDARHAHNFYTSNSFEFAPKTKYLYHVVFTLTADARSSAVSTEQYSKQISMLVKSADLPGFSAQIETKKQYNRTKHLQTGIEYDPVAIRFHDDNKSVTSRLFEEYYRYYFRDGNKFVNPGDKIDFESRDLYGGRVPRYGMDGAPIRPFFDNIKIFQMSRQRWRCYTLINPIVEKWQHDSLDNSDAAGLMENTMNIVYEGVLYSDGDVTLESEPAGFGSQETLYDTMPSPLGTDSNYPNLGEEEKIPGRLIPPPARSTRFSNSGSIAFSNPLTQSTRDPGGFPNIQFPSAAGQQIASVLGTENQVRDIDGDRIVQALGADSEILNSVVNRALMTGSVSGFSINNFQDFLNLAPNTKNAITGELLESIAGGDKKLQQIASQAIKRASK
jgi:hypothetical protein